MMECYDLPITRKITSRKNLSGWEQIRVGLLKTILRFEKRLPPDTSIQEMEYLLRVEQRRKRHQERRCIRFFDSNGQEVGRGILHPFCEGTIEVILASMARKKDEQNEGLKDEIRGGKNF